MTDTRPIRQQPPGPNGEGDLGIVDALAQLTFLVQGMLAHHASAHDMSMAQTRLLGVLRDREPTMHELALLLGLDKSSVTGLIDRAVQRGFVDRAPSTEDRRAVHVVLTPKGRRLIDAVAEAFEREIRSATDCLSTDQVRELSLLATTVVRDRTGSS